MESTVSPKNWIASDHAAVLETIHRSELNIAIYNRDLTLLKGELDQLLNSEFEFRTSGETSDILNDIRSAPTLNNLPQLKADLEDLFIQFRELTKAGNFRLFFATVRNNMCRKFHTDINDLRMLCTYVGPGTLWLSEDNINRAAENSEDEELLVIDEDRIMQASEGDVLVLKGAIYPKEETTPILHRSPTIEESGQKRILLRIDTDEFANF